MKKIFFLIFITTNHMAYASQACEKKNNPIHGKTCIYRPGEPVDPEQRESLRKQLRHLGVTQQETQLDYQNRLAAAKMGIGTTFHERAEIKARDAAYTRSYFLRFFSCFS